jgi:hypothetical protein
MENSLLLSAFIIAFALSCNTNTDNVTSAQTKKILEAMHGTVACFEKKDFSRLGNYFASDAVDHSGESGISGALIV